MSIPSRTRLALIAVPLLLVLVAVASVTAAPLRQVFDPPSESVPETITYQGVLTDANGATVNDGPYTAIFRIYNRPTGGTSLWEERHTVQVSGGLFSTVLGSQRDLSRALESGPDLYLGITVGSTELRPRQPITSVPFAVRASDAETLNGLSAQDIVDGALGSADCALERRLATAVDRYVAPAECLPAAVRLDTGVSPDVTPSIAINRDGNPVIAYATANGRPRLALCQDPRCDNFLSATINPDLSMEGDITVALDSFDQPVVTFMDADTGNLVIAACGGSACFEVSTNVVDDAPSQSPDSFQAAGRFHAMVLVEDDRPRIIYARERNRQNRDGGESYIALCADRLCEEVTLKGVGSSFSSQAPDDPTFYSGPGTLPSLTLGTDGFPLGLNVQKTPFDFANDQVSFLRCDNADCDSAFGSGILSGFNGLTSTAVSVAPDGNQVAVMTIGDTVVYIRCTSFNCNGTSQTRPDHTGSNGVIQTQGASGHVNDALPVVDGVSMALLPGGSVLLAYNDEGVGAMVARCADVACSTAPVPTRIGKDVIGGTDMALGPDGVPYIVFTSFDRGLGFLVPTVLRCEECADW